MTLDQIEELVQKAIAIDCLASRKFILLLYADNEDALNAYMALTDKFDFSEELSIHIDYADSVNMSIISKATADTIKINKVPYSKDKETYVQLMGLLELSKPTDFIHFNTGFLLPNGEYEIAYKPEKSEISNPTNDKLHPRLLKTIGITRKFIS